MLAEMYSVNLKKAHEIYQLSPSRYIAMEVGGVKGGESQNLPGFPPALFLPTWALARTTCGGLSLNETGFWALPLLSCLRVNFCSVVLIRMLKEIHS